MSPPAGTLTSAKRRSPIAMSGLATAGALLILAVALAILPLRWSAGAVLAAGLVVAVLLRPAIGVIALAFTVPFGSALTLPGLPANANDLFVALTAGAWLLQGLARRRMYVSVPGPVWPLLVFVWVAGLSLTQAISWREGLPEWLKWVEVAALYVAVANILDRRSTAWMLGALLAAGVAQALLGGYQFWRQIGPEAFVLMGRFMRAYGTFRQPNPYAGYLGYLAPVAVSLAVMLLGEAVRCRRWSRLWAGLTVAAASVAIIAGIGMSWSRGSWLALAAALLVVMGFREVRGFANRRLALITLAVLLAGGLVISVAAAGWLPGGIAGRLSELSEYVGGFDPAHTEITDANFSVLERIAHWRAGLAMFSDHPWLGIGIGNYAAAYPQYAPPHWYEPLGHAHNVGIHLLAETGILGGLSFLLFWLALLLSAWRGARMDEDPRETKIPDRGGADPFRRALAIGLAGTWAYLTIHGIFDNLFVQHMQLQLALLWGGLAALRTGQGSTSEMGTS